MFHAHYVDTLDEGNYNEMSFPFENRYPVRRQMHPDFELLNSNSK